MSRAYVKLTEKIVPTYPNIGNSTIYAACIGEFKRGAVNKPVIPGGRTSFLKMYTPKGTVGIGYATAYYSVLMAYQGTDNIVVVRSAPDDAYCANTTFYAQNDTRDTAIDGTSYPNKLEDSEYEFANNESLYIRAADRGAWGNDISIKIYNYKEIELVKVGASVITSTQKWGNGYPVRVAAQSGKKLDSNLNETSVYYVSNSGSNLKLHQSTSDAINGLNPVSFSAGDDIYITPAVNYAKTPNTFTILVYYNGELEKTYNVSKDQTLKVSGATTYIEDVINNGEFIHVQNNLFQTNPYVNDILEPVFLTQGSDGSPIKTSDLITSLECIKDNSQYNIKVIFDGGYSDIAYQNAMIDQCKQNMSRVAVITSPTELQNGSSMSVAQSIVNWRNLTGAFNSTYGVTYAPHQKIYDEFNDRYIFVAPDGMAVCNIFQTASNYALWYPVAGVNRGIINSLDCMVRFDEPSQDILYDNGINPIIFDNEDGIMIWGQKTLKKTPAIDDRLNVRLMLITIEPDIKKMLKSKLFELNNSATRASVRELITSYMDNVVSKNGAKSYKLTCDETNNTDGDIDAHILNVELLVCPMNSIEWINFSVGVTSNTISFDSVQQLTA